MLLYLTAAPEHLDAGLTLTSHIAHAAFRIVENGTLVAQLLPPTLRGGIMVLSCTSPFPPAAAPALAREALRICTQRSFSGILLDSPAAAPAVLALIRQLLPLSRTYHRKLYLPECCAAQAGGATIVICTALSGGSLRQRLEDACAQYGAEHLALDLQRLRMSFPLPCPSGSGRPLSGEELALRQQGRSVFFCSALCARYFTCTHAGQTEFILFDDADTLRQKLALAEQLGIREGFFLWPESADLLPALLGKKKEAEQ